MFKLNFASKYILLVVNGHSYHSLLSKVDSVIYYTPLTTNYFVALILKYAGELAKLCFAENLRNKASISSLVNA